MGGGRGKITGKDGKLFSSTNQPKNRGRKPKIYTVLKEQGFGKDDIKTAFGELAFYTLPELKKVGKDPKTPIIVRIVANQLEAALNDSDWNKIKDIIEHVIGKASDNNTAQDTTTTPPKLTTAQEISLIYTQNVLFARDYRVVVNRGGTRSTKSYSIAQIAVDWLLGGKELYKEPTEGKTFSIVRKSSPVLKATVIKDVVNLLKERNVYGNEVEHHKTEKEFKYDGRTLDYFSLDDEQKVRGRKRDYLFIDEANECDYDTFTQLMFRCAGTCFLAFNPDDPHVWINTKIEQERKTKIGDVAVVQSSYRNNPFLSAAQVREIEMLRDMDEEYWQVFGLGEYGVITGQVFKKWDTYTDLPKDRKFHRLLGFDYGSEVDPSAILVIYCDSQNMEVYIKELLYEKTDSLSFIYDVLGAEKDEIILDNSASTLYHELLNKGYNVLKCVKGADSIINGIDIVKKYKMFVHRDAVNVQKELGLYKRPKDPKTGTYLKKPLDLYNHAMDSMRYAITHYDRNYNFKRK